MFETLKHVLFYQISVPMYFLFLVILLLYLFFQRFRRQNKELIASSTFSSTQVGELQRCENREKTYMACPLGWYVVAYSHEVKATEDCVLSIHFAGIDLVCYRKASDGKPVVLDAYCPHMGAHLGKGGKNIDDCVRCPFHHWCFDAKGECVKIPYTDKKIPKNATVKSWTCMDWGGFVIVWYHPQGKEPYYHPPEDVQKLFKGMYQLQGNMRDLHTHAFEIMENCSDPIHFKTLHSHVALPFGIPSSWLTVSHEIKCKENENVLEFYNYPRVGLFDKWYLKNMVEVHVSFVGITFTIWRFHIKYFGTIIMVKGLTQVSPSVCIERDYWFADKKVPRLLVWFINMQGLGAFNEDLVVWSNKIFKRNPLVVAGDGKIIKRRRWMKKFFVNLDW